MAKDAKIASYTHKENAPSEHWERSYHQWDPSKNMKDTHGSDFAPKQAKNRKTTYLKVNETDH